MRCDGNKAGCKRCSEKHLDCTYSESMVGKVVGKRKKRPSNSKQGEQLPNQWSISGGPTTLPSPAPTNASAPTNKRVCSDNDWPHVDQYDSQYPLDYSTCGEQFLNFDMCQPSEMNAAGEGSYNIGTNLPTPSMSPDHTQYLTPVDFEVMTPTTQASSIPRAPPSDQTTLYPLSGTYQPLQHTEDDEVMLIRLLTQLKRLSQNDHTFKSAISIVDKTNSAIKRMLRSSMVRTDYTCHLLLTSILVHLVTFCDMIVTLRDPYTTEELRVTSNLAGQFENEDLPIEVPAKRIVLDTITVCTSTGNLLKRLPHNGFQVVGKNEAALINLEKRLRHIVTLL